MNLVEFLFGYFPVFLKTLFQVCISFSWVFATIRFIEQGETEIP